MERKSKKVHADAQEAEASENIAVEQPDAEYEVESGQIDVIADNQRAARIDTFDDGVVIQLQGEADHVGPRGILGADAGTGRKSHRVALN